MNIEDIINQIGELLENFKFDEANEDSKTEALNVANGILYPLKESLAIEDYQFTAKTEDNSISITISIKEFSQDEMSQWDLILQKD
jgi:hypothetical protein